MQHSFKTRKAIINRESRAEYACDKYQSILIGSILDVGADECYLKQYLPVGVQYWGIGLGGHPDQQLDLEKERLPFEDNSYDCVLCMDVLEHLDNIHQVFEELCRVTRRYVIISLPNPLGDFYVMLQYGDYRPGQGVKFYGLPADPPKDRHKWIFSYTEAEAFIRSMAAKSNMSIIDMAPHKVREPESGFRGWLKKIAKRILLHKNISDMNLYASSLWVVLEKQAIQNREAIDDEKTAKV